MSCCRPSAHSGGRYFISACRQRMSSSSSSSIVLTISSVSFRKLHTVSQSLIHSVCSCSLITSCSAILSTSPLSGKQVIDTGFPETVVFSRKQDQVAVVHQSSDKGSRHLLIIQYIDPSGEFQICIQDDDFLLMDLGKVVKQQLGTCPVIGNISEFIQDQDICPGQFFSKRQILRLG